MQNNHNNPGHDDLAEICSRAQHRRAEDIYSWLTQFLERTRRCESSAPAAVQRMKTALAVRALAESIARPGFSTACVTALRNGRRRLEVGLPVASGVIVLALAARSRLDK